MFLAVRLGKVRVLDEIWRAQSAKENDDPQGIAAIERYWFTPGGPPTTITELNITVDQVSGSGTVAFARGLDSVARNVEQGGAVHRHAHPGTYLNVMRRQPDGSWLIQVHMWDDGSEHVE